MGKLLIPILAMALGLAAMFVGLASRRGPGRLPEASAVARVGRVEITRGAFDLAVARAEKEAGPLSQEARRELLDWMIYTELAVEKAHSLGLLSTDLILRRRLVQLIRDLAMLKASEVQPTDEELKSFFAEHAAALAAARAVQVDQVFVRKGGDARRRIAGLRRLAFAEAVSRSDAPAYALARDAWLDAGTVRKLFGQRALAAIMALAPGEVSAPVEGPDGWHVFKVLAAKEGPTDFEANREKVLMLYRRTAERRALIAYLDSLRKEGDVWIDPTLVDP